MCNNHTELECWWAPAHALRSLGFFFFCAVVVLVQFLSCFFSFSALGCAWGSMVGSESWTHVVSEVSRAAVKLNSPNLDIIKFTHMVATLKVWGRSFVVWPYRGSKYGFFSNLLFKCWITTAQDLKISHATKHFDIFSCFLNWETSSVNCKYNYII